MSRETSNSTIFFSIMAVIAKYRTLRIQNDVLVSCSSGFPSSFTRCFSNVRNKIYSYPIERCPISNVCHSGLLGVWDPISMFLIP